MASLAGRLWPAALLVISAALFGFSFWRQPRIFVLDYTETVPARSDRPVRLYSENGLELYYQSTDVILPVVPLAEAIFVPLWAKGESTRPWKSLPWFEDLRKALVGTSLGGPGETAKADEGALQQLAARGEGTPALPRGRAELFALAADVSYRKQSRVRAFSFAAVRAPNTSGAGLTGDSLLVAATFDHAFAQLHASGITAVAVPYFAVPTVAEQRPDEAGSWEYIVAASVEAARKHGISRLVYGGFRGPRNGGSNYDEAFQAAWRKWIEPARARRFMLAEEALRLPTLFLGAAVLGRLAQGRRTGWRVAVALLVVAVGLSGLTLFEILDKAVTALGIEAGAMLIVALLKVGAAVAGGWWLRAVLNWDAEEVLR